MKKLRLTMIAFAVLVSLPLSVVAWRTYSAMERESQSQVRFFSDQLFDGIEAWLADLVRREENRAVDEYQHRMVTADGRSILSPLAGMPSETYVLGYFQNNPDGSFQTPLMEGEKDAPPPLVTRVAKLEALNAGFNQRKRGQRPASPKAAEISSEALAKPMTQPSFAKRFLNTDQRKKSKMALGQKAARTEEITASQAMNLARQDRAPQAWLKEEERIDAEQQTMGASSFERARQEQRAAVAVQPDNIHFGPPSTADRFQVEVAPLQAITMDDGEVFVFRRIVIDGRIYRQGIVIEPSAFLDHLLTTFYDSQPIARYTRLVLNAAGIEASRNLSEGNEKDRAPENVLSTRTFPAPFDFLSAEMQLASLPPSPARRFLTLSLVMLGVVMVVGLGMIYRHARAVLDLSERRSRFVSTVTHELKTPLTNIRMYIEMLEQGIAPTPEREREYLGVLSSESARLSGLIENVLELSRLERQTRRFMLSEGDLSDVLSEAQASMAERLARESFDLAIDKTDLPVFAYDREVLVQILINLMENSIKFGRHLEEKKIRIQVRAQEGWVRLRVSDTGPGIPRASLSKVFDEFYRVDDTLTQAVGGTGIGLALVKKLILAMGGRVRAENNQGPGCTMIIDLPMGRREKTA